MKILIINQHAYNKGDRAILLFMLSELIANGIKDITVSTDNKQVWKQYQIFSGVHINFIPWGWWVYTGTWIGRAGILLGRLRGKFYFDYFYAIARDILLKGTSSSLRSMLCRRYNPPLWKAMINADIILTVGGHHLTTLLYKDAICPQTQDMTLAAISGKPLILWSQSIGPFHFHNPDNALQVRKILEYARRVYIRDFASNVAIQSIGAHSTYLFETPDSVFGLRRFAQSRNVPPSKRESVLGISIYTGRASRKVENEVYIKSLAAMVTHAADQKFHIRFFPMHLADKYEQRMISDIISFSKREHSCSILESLTEIPNHIEEVSKCRLFIGHKTHSVIFALMAGVPLIAIAYHVKTLDFMKQFDFEEYGIDESRISPNSLITLFDCLVSRLDDFYFRQQEIAQRLEVKVKQDFADMLRCMNQEICR